MSPFSNSRHPVRARSCDWHCLAIRVNRPSSPSAREAKAIPETSFRSRPSNRRSASSSSGSDAPRLSTRLGRASRRKLDDARRFASDWARSRQHVACVKRMESLSPLNPIQKPTPMAHSMTFKSLCIPLIPADGVSNCFRGLDNRNWLYELGEGPMAPGGSSERTFVNVPHLLTTTNAFGPHIRLQVMVPRVWSRLRWVWAEPAVHQADLLASAVRQSRLLRPIDPGRRSVHGAPLLERSSKPARTSEGEVHRARLRQRA